MSNVDFSIIIIIIIYLYIRINRWDNGLLLRVKLVCVASFNLQIEKAF